MQGHCRLFLTQSAATFASIQQRKSIKSYDRRDIQIETLHCDEAGENIMYESSVFIILGFIYVLKKRA